MAEPISNSELDAMEAVAEARDGRGLYGDVLRLIDEVRRLRTIVASTDAILARSLGEQRRRGDLSQQVQR